MDRPLNHDAIAELLGAYALDAVDPDDATAVEEHLAVCPRCRDEVAHHHQTAGLLASSGGEAPAELWDGIASRLKRPPDMSGPPRPLPLGPRRGSPPAQTKWTSSRLARGVGALIAVAAAVAIIVLGVQIAHLNHRVNQVAASRGTQNLSEAARLALLDPQSRRIVLTGSGPASRALAEVVVGGSGTAFLFNQGLPALPAGRTYQLWLTGGARPVSLGLLGSNPDTVAFAIGPARVANAFAVSVEPAAGSIAPTLAPVAASAT
jgi:anti-sigma factor RsiW